MPSLFTEANITRMVHAFYARVRADEQLAPIFATKIGEADWDVHMDHIADFWCSIFLKTGQFNGNPMQKHLGVAGLTPELFTRWLTLFKETADKTLSPAQAKAIHVMAQRIAQSLQMGLAFHADKSGQTDHPFTDFGVRRSHP